MTTRANAIPSQSAPKAAGEHVPSREKADPNDCRAASESGGVGDESGGVTGGTEGAAAAGGATVGSDGSGNGGFQPGSDGWKVNV